MKKIVSLLASLVITLHAISQHAAIDSLSAILEKSSIKDSNTVAIYHALYNEWLPLNKDSALYFASLSFELSSKLKDRKNAATSRSYQAQVHREKGDFARAYELYLEALHKFTILGDQLGIATANIGLGKTFESQENYTKALQYFQRSLGLFEEMDSKPGLAAIYLNLGIIHAKTYQYDKSLDYLTRSAKLAETLPDKTTAIEAHNFMGMVYDATKQNRKAIHSLVRAKNLSLIAAKVPSVAEAYLNMGNTYLKISNADSANTCFSAALNYFIQLKDTENIARTYKGMADLNFQAKQYDKASHFLDLSNQFALEEKNKLLMYDNYMLLIAIKKAVGDLKGANDLYEKVLVLKDNLYSAEKLSGIENVKALYELEKKQKTIDELQEDIDLKTQQKNYLVLAFSISAVSMLLLMYSAWQIKKKTLLLASQKQLVEQQKNELENQKKELEDLHVVKDKFFSVLSHDLRSPMGNILGLLNLISMEGVISEDEKKQLFNRLKLSTSSALETMDNMLAWGKNQIKANKIEIKEVNVHEIADRVCRFLNQIAENKSIAIINEVDPAIKIMADKHRLEFVIRNLVSNALKFSHKNSKIEVWTSTDDTYVNIHVRDFGTGMKRELQDKLFDVNKRESVNGTAGETGSGLGLALSKEFVTQNNGNILVNSEPGKGTIFTIQHRLN